MSKLECVEENGKKYATEIPYSTSEKRIGTWSDGKPLYRGVIESGSISDSDQYFNGPQNIDKMIDFKAVVTYQTNEGLCDTKAPTYMSNNAQGNTFLYLAYNQKGHTYRGNAFYFYNSNKSNIPIQNLRIIYEYTKTTD